MTERLRSGERSAVDDCIQASSKLDAACDLHLARSVDCVGRNPKGVVVWLSIGRAECVAIERVEKFDFKDEVCLFTDRRFLQKTEVFIKILIISNLGQLNPLHLEQQLA